MFFSDRSLTLVICDNYVMLDCLLIIILIIEIVMIMMTSVVTVTSVIPATRKRVFSVGVTGY